MMDVEFDPEMVALSTLAAETGAPCTRDDPEKWFPTGHNGRPHNGSEERAREYARKQCAGCPVTAQCLAYALKDRTILGIWGGTTERDRARLQKGRNLRPHGTDAARRRHRKRGEQPCEACARTARGAA